MMQDVDSYNELKAFYVKHFSLGYLGNDIKTKFALISLICYLKHKLEMKKPDVTYYQIIKKLGEDLPDDFIKGLAIICNDFGCYCKDFPTFDIEEKNIPSKVKEILSTWLPF